VHPQAAKRRTLNALRERREEILHIASTYGASNIRVFGSVARGDDDEKSDIDLLVDFDDRASGFAYFGRIEDLKQALTELLGREVDVMDSSGLKDANVRTPRLERVRQRVLAEAVHL
jgi:uncharacterized protein